MQPQYYHVIRCILSQDTLPSTLNDWSEERVSKKTDKLPSLEASLAEITQLIDKMEHSEQTLEQSLSHFERGISLIKHCQKILLDTEQKVRILTQNNNQETLSPYGGTDDNDSEDTEHAD